MRHLTEALEAFDTYLDSTYPDEPNRGFTPAQVLKGCDPIGYRVTFHDWADAEGIDIDTLTQDASI
jgi:hypothetical protein